MRIEELCRYIGQTVTIFTTSGGVSGCGFTGVLLLVNPCYCTLCNRTGTPPSNPFANSNICDRGENFNTEADHYYTVGSVCDIPIDKIASFCHNAI